MKRVKPHPRNKNVYTSKDSKPLVVRVPHFNGDYLPDSIQKAVDLLGGIEKCIRRGDRVFIKPNFNCEFRLPLSTDLAFLAAIIELLQDIGAECTVGEMSGRAAGSTERVVELLQVRKVLKRYNVPFINFERDEWLELHVDGKLWKSFCVPRTIYEAERRVYLANMRPHSSARFSASLKLSVGWISSKDRDFLHVDPGLVGWKIPELHLGWQPDLIFIDGRRSTIRWDGRGEYIYPNVILASGDMVAIDAEAVKILKTFPGDNDLGLDVAEMEQIRGAIELGLGTLEYELIEAPGNRKTEQEGLPSHMRKLKIRD
ncbi:MAG: DUF362 domain-containing protein [Candidatus Methanomethylicaceae archaeon]